MMELRLLNNEGTGERAGCEVRGIVLDDLQDLPTIVADHVENFTLPQHGHFHFTLLVLACKVCLEIEPVIGTIRGHLKKGYSAGVQGLG
jgi:hypothetical protein